MYKIILESGLSSNTKPEITAAARVNLQEMVYIEEYQKK